MKQDMKNSPHSMQAGRDIIIKQGRKKWYYNPWLLLIVGAILSAYIIPKYFFKHTGENMTFEKSEEVKQDTSGSPQSKQAGRDVISDIDAKVNIQDSNFHKSPVIVDSPGAHVDNSTKINIVADKEALGIREPLGLYRDGKKVATVINPEIDKNNSSFKFEGIRFSEPIVGNKVNLDAFNGPYEFQNFKVIVQHYDSMSTFPTPLLGKVTGKIISSSR